MGALIGVLLYQSFTCIWEETQKAEECKVVCKGGPVSEARETEQLLTSAPQGSSQDCSSITRFVIYPIKSLSTDCSAMNAGAYFPFKILFLLQQHL